MSLGERKSGNTSDKVRQACEYCRSRKIRCNNLNPCPNCQRINIPCLYQEPKKKGPRRRDILQEIPRSIPKEQSRSLEHVNTVSSVPSADRFQPSPLLSLEVFQRCLDIFFANKYPVMPILDRETTYASLHELHDSPAQYSLVTSLCAVIMMQTAISLRTDRGGFLDTSQQFDCVLTVDFFIKETYRAREFFDQVESPCLASVQTSFFLFSTLSQLLKDNSAWLHLRESITMLQLLNLHEEDSYTTMTDPCYAALSRRTFWLLFITEQAYALQRHLPLTLRRPIGLPIVSDDQEATIVHGFLDSINLFRNFGDGFMSLWNSAERNHPRPVSTRPFIKLQEFLKDAIANVRDRSEIQQADLLITRQWLKMIVWQLCLKMGMLSSNAIIDSMSFHYPIDIARDVTLVTRLLPLEAFQANGVGILGKIFDIGSSLADVLLVHPHILHGSTIEIGPKDYLMDMVRILDMDIQGHTKYLVLLANRVDECLGVRVPRPPLSSSNGSPANCEIDWDEGSDEVYDSSRSSPY